MCPIHCTDGKCNKKWICISQKLPSIWMSKTCYESSILALNQAASSIWAGWYVLKLWLAFASTSFRSTKYSTKPTTISARATSTITSQAGNSIPATWERGENTTIWIEFHGPPANQPSRTILTVIMTCNCATPPQHQTTSFNFWSAHAQYNCEMDEM